jgi:hypothetical protein
MSEEVFQRLISNNRKAINYTVETVEVANSVAY